MVDSTRPSNVDQVFFVLGHGCREQCRSGCLHAGGGSFALLFFPRVPRREYQRFPSPTSLRKQAVATTASILVPETGVPTFDRSCSSSRCFTYTCLSAGGSYLAQEYSLSQIFALRSIAVQKRWSMISSICARRGRRFTLFSRSAGCVMTC